MQLGKTVRLSKMMYHYARVGREDIEMFSIAIGMLKINW